MTPESDKSFIRLQSYLAQMGVASRRTIELWISEQRIVVDGKHATLGQRICGDERVVIDGEAIKLASLAKQKIRVVMYHKPVGVICTRFDEKERTTVFSQLPEPHQGRWISVGRLDIHSSGLLLLTTDGQLAHRLMHPSSGFVRSYLVRVDQKLSMAQCQTLRQGITIDGQTYQISDLKLKRQTTSNPWYQVSLYTGKNQEVRQLFAEIGVQVSRLMRIQYGPITLPKSLHPGQYKDLSFEQVKELQL